MALFATVIPLLALIRGMQLVGAARASLLFTIEPVATVLLAAYLFNEPLTLGKIAGSALILLSAILIGKEPLSEKRVEGYDSSPT